VLAAHAPEPSRASSDRLGRDGTRALLAAVKKAVPDLAEKHAFSNVFEGFAADLTASQLSRLRSLGLDVQPDVIHVAQGAREGPRGAGGADGRRRRLQSSSSGGAASAPPWPLDRLDQPKLPLDMRRSWTQNGSSVDVYIIDSARGPSVAPSVPASAVVARRLPGSVASLIQHPWVHARLISLLTRTSLRRSPAFRRARSRD
jgi:hypothetical protein